VSVALAAGVAKVASEVLGAIATALAAPAAVVIGATQAGQIDGITRVRNWPGGWKASEHAKNVFAAMNQGLFGPWRWVPVAVGSRLVVQVMHDALSIGNNPPCRIPINASNCQRLADRLGAQLKKKLLLPTQLIADAVHLGAVRGSGRAIACVTASAFWPPSTGPDAGEKPPGINRGQYPPQWLMAQEKIRDVIKAAGGYPLSGVVSTVGKDVVLTPRTAIEAVPNHPGGEASGAKMHIYGWHTRQKPLVPPSSVGPWPPQLLDLVSAGWPGITQQESGRHTDQDTGDAGGGGFWDYSSSLRLVLDDCTVDGKTAKLSDVYAQQPELVYNFQGGPRRAIPVRYPMIAPGV
jgi:hypothetical protein